MLLTAKAYAEGGRAFSSFVALHIDRELNHPDEAVRKEAGEMVTLLTPIIKAFMTDNGWIATSEAMQVHGGHGYITGTGIEQYVRDARINMIYEGTNTVQSLDLLGRKILMDNGAKLKKFGALVQAFVEENGTDEAMSALESSTLMLLVGTIPIGLAMESTGLVMTIVDGMINLIGTANLVLFLAVFYIITASLTEILSNNAVAVLLTPVALSLATTLNISPLPLLVAVLFGASAAFMTPFGYQTNAIVMGPGGYKFVDYLRIGLPLQLIMITVATIFIPIFWPF